MLLCVAYFFSFMTSHIFFFAVSIAACWQWLLHWDLKREIVECLNILPHPTTLASRHSNVLQARFFSRCLHRLQILPGCFTRGSRAPNPSANPAINSRYTWPCCGADTCVTAWLPLSHSSPSALLLERQNRSEPPLLLLVFGAMLRGAFDPPIP